MSLENPLYPESSPSGHCSSRSYRYSFLPKKHQTLESLRDSAQACDAITVLPYPSPFMHCEPPHGPYAATCCTAAARYSCRINTKPTAQPAGQPYELTGRLMMLLQLRAPGPTPIPVHAGPQPHRHIRSHSHCCTTKRLLTTHCCWPVFSTQLPALFQYLAPFCCQLPGRGHGHRPAGGDTVCDGVD